MYDIAEEGAQWRSASLAAGPAPAHAGSARPEDPPASPGLARPARAPTLSRRQGPPWTRRRRCCRPRPGLLLASQMLVRTL
eukprot:15443557-Alexandrium_andersonii.AAC.1